MTPQEQVAQALIDYGPRHGDPTQRKGRGFYGPIPIPGGGVSTEISGEMDGLEFPLIYEGIPEKDLYDLIHNRPLSPTLYHRAYEAAQDRKARGLSPFAHPEEERPLPYPMPWEAR